MEMSSLSDAEFKILVKRMLKDLSENINSIKKIPSEMNSLIEIKNNLQRNNSRMDEVENQINEMKHKETKNNPNNKKKKEPRK